MDARLSLPACSPSVAAFHLGAGKPSSDKASRPSGVRPAHRQAFAFTSRPQRRPARAVREIPLVQRDPPFARTELNPHGQTVDLNELIWPLVGGGIIAHAELPLTVVAPVFSFVVIPKYPSATVLDSRDTPRTAITSSAIARLGVPSWLSSPPGRWQMAGNHASNRGA